MTFKDWFKTRWNNYQEQSRQKIKEQKELKDLERQSVREGYKEEVMKMAKKHGKNLARNKYNKKKEAQSSILTPILNMGNTFDKETNKMFDISGMNIGKNVNAEDFAVKNEDLKFMNTTEAIGHNLKKQKKDNIKKKENKGFLDWDI